MARSHPLYHVPRGFPFAAYVPLEYPGTGIPPAHDVNSICIAFIFLSGISIDHDHDDEDGYEPQADESVQEIVDADWIFRRLVAGSSSAAVAIMAMSHKTG